MNRTTWRIWAATFLIPFGAGVLTKVDAAGVPGLDIVGYIALALVPELIVGEVMARWRRALRENRG